MKTPSRALVLVLTAALPLAAQDPPAESKPPVQWGLGVTLSPMALLLEDSFGFLPLGISNFLVPIRMNTNLMVEPEFGMFRTSSDGGAGESSFNSLRLGVGILAGLKERGGLRPYLGPRFGLSRTTTKSSFGTSTTTTKQMTWFFSGVAGAHHFFSPNFSLGGELQLTRAAIGEEEETPPPPSSPSSSQSFISTTGVVMLRWFF